MLQSYPDMFYHTHPHINIYTTNQELGGLHYLCSRFFSNHSAQHLLCARLEFRQRGIKQDKKLHRRHLKLRLIQLSPHSRCRQHNILLSRCQIMQCEQTVPGPTCKWFPRGVHLLCQLKVSKRSVKWYLEKPLICAWHFFLEFALSCSWSY